MGTWKPVTKGVQPRWSPPAKPCSATGCHGRVPDGWTRWGPDAQVGSRAGFGGHRPGDSPVAHCLWGRRPAHPISANSPAARHHAWMEPRRGRRSAPVRAAWRVRRHLIARQRLPLLPPETRWASPNPRDDLPQISILLSILAHSSPRHRHAHRRYLSGPRRARRSFRCPVSLSRPCNSRAVLIWNEMKWPPPAPRLDIA